MSTLKQRQDIVIIGGGVIGCTTAYYLSRHPRFDPSIHTITVVEAAKVGNGASGKAGGLLASWAHSGQLAGLSFDLHDQLAKEHDGVELWGYRRVRCGQLTLVRRQRTDNIKLRSRRETDIPPEGWRSGDRKKASVLPDELNWFHDEDAQAYEELANMDSTAQVNPLQFTTCIAKLAEEAGAKIITGVVEHINCSDAHSSSDVPVHLSSLQDLTGKKVVSVTYIDKATSESHTILTPTVVLAAGPWTPTLLL